MKLEDVRIDGKTEYLCRKNRNWPRLCVIEASFVSDGASLVARSQGGSDFLNAWVTEARWLTELPDMKAVRILVISGPAGCGKTTLAKFLVARKGCGNVIYGNPYFPTAVLYSMLLSRYATPTTLILDGLPSNPAIWNELEIVVANNLPKYDTARPRGEGELLSAILCAQSTPWVTGEVPANVTLLNLG